VKSVAKEVLQDLKNRKKTGSKKPPKNDRSYVEGLGEVVGETNTVWGKIKT